MKVSGGRGDRGDWEFPPRPLWDAPPQHHLCTLRKIHSHGHFKALGKDSVPLTKSLGTPTYGKCLKSLGNLRYTYYPFLCTFRGLGVTNFIKENCQKHAPTNLQFEWANFLFKNKNSSLDGRNNSLPQWKKRKLSRQSETMESFLGSICVFSLLLTFLWHWCRCWHFSACSLCHW